MTVPTGLPVGTTGIADRSTGYELKPNLDGSIPTSPATGSNQRVNAQSGDFDAGAIVDLATLLTLAGTPSDANTVASLMGRLTKIRDLLDATLTITGTVTANAGTNLNTSLLALESGGNLAALAGIVSGGKGAVRAASGDFASGAIADLAKGQAVKASSHPVTMASDQGPLTASTATKANVAASATSVTIFAANNIRKGASVFNDSSATLYLDESGGTASATSFTVKVPADTLWELSGPVIYTGLVTGIWSSATGYARTKELT